jgi:hypothetical protein
VCFAVPGIFGFSADCPEDKEIGEHLYRGVCSTKRMAMHFAEEHAYLYLIMQDQAGRVPLSLRLSFARKAATAAVRKGLSDRFRKGLASYAATKGIPTRPGES